MILIIHNNELWIKFYLNVLYSSSIQYIEISIDQFINTTSIFRKIEESFSIHLYRFGVINFNKITGILLSQIRPTKSNLFWYHNTDKQYAQAEWTSLLEFIIFKHHNVVNRYSYSIFENTYNSYPEQLELANKHGFLVPNYYFSSDRLKLNNMMRRYKNFFVKSSIYDLNLIKKTDPSCVIGIVENKQGKFVYVYIINIHITAYTFNSKQKKFEFFELNEQRRIQCILYAQTIKKNFVQLLLMFVKEKDFYFYSASTDEDWLNTCPNTGWWVNHLTCVLNPNNKIKFDFEKKHSFLPISNRPKLET